MKSLFFHSSKSSPSRTFSSTSSSPSQSSHARPSTPLSESMLESKMSHADTLITKWDPDSSSYAKITSLFFENRGEARDFIKSVSDIQRAMHFYVSDSSSHHKLVHAQRLMQIAMKRLEKEFYQILATNRDHLDPDSISARSSTATTRSTSSDDEDADIIDDDAGEAIKEVECEASLAMSDLRSITDCMISSGYGKECVKIYKIIRRSIVDEGVYRLGVEKLSSNNLNKLDWETVEEKIKIWINAIKVSVKNLFSGERILCDQVFSASDAIKESCFSEICKDAAIGLLGFPESVSKCKKSPEKMFRFLDMYDVISELWPEIESIFSFESTSVVRSQAVTSLVKLGDAVRTTVANFESAMQKDSSRMPVPGGGVHPLTKYVMNYVCFLGDYSGILADIFADYPLQTQTPLPVAMLENSPSSEDPISSIAARFEWLILVLLCKLDGKAELYKDVALSYLFLANNLHYVVSKARGCDVRFLLGEEWLSKNESKVHQYTANYERMAWAKVLLSLPPNPTAELPAEEAKAAFRSFNSAFDTAYRTQSTWIVPEGKLRDEIKVSIARKIVPPYRAFYDKYRVLLQKEPHLEVVVRFAPENLENYLSDLFYGTGVSGSAAGTKSSVHSRVSAQ
ncbi:exocyst complex component EXO70B1-like protein [Cinnamomum micranthum f. kanehirae]|uniref:Exocyst subunit Exo70 family protein n=1 Tax=Cinnamomum micranthum f. kanehirae TaxID=337451 RepID=A0A443PXK6_9MAGN|nr:exocyst complex component EXO70B1-like protein [Cinnamomum micranthum f. kanehirae]